MNRWMISVVIAATMVLASQAEADEDNFYFQGLVGKRFLTESDLTLNGTTNEVEISTDAVPTGSGAIGYRFSSFPHQSVDARIEVEGGASESEPETIQPSGVLAAQVGTTEEVGFDAENVHSIFGMVNLWIDYNLSESWLVSAGGGLGAAYIDWDRANIGGQVILDDGDLVFAYQGGVAVGYEIIPDLVISLDYRYFATSDAQINFNGDWSAEYGSHNVLFGFRYFFW